MVGAEVKTPHSGQVRHVVSEFWTKNQMNCDTMCSPESRVKEDSCPDSRCAEMTSVSRVTAQVIKIDWSIFP